MYPDYDWMILEKHEENKSVIIRPDGVKTESEMVPFKILAIGPGRHENGVFIRASHKPGDLVFIHGPMIEAKYKKATYKYAMERNIVSHLE